MCVNGVSNPPPPTVRLQHELLSSCCTSPETVQLRLPAAGVNPPPRFISTVHDASVHPPRTDQNLPEHVVPIRTQPCTPQRNFSPGLVAQLLFYIFFFFGRVVKNMKSVSVYPGFIINLYVFY